MKKNAVVLSVAIAAGLRGVSDAAMGRLQGPTDARAASPAMARVSLSFHTDPAARLPQERQALRAIGVLKGLGFAPSGGLGRKIGHAENGGERYYVNGIMPRGALERALSRIGVTTDKVQAKAVRNPASVPDFDGRGNRPVPEAETASSESGWGAGKARHLVRRLRPVKAASAGPQGIDGALRRLDRRAGKWLDALTPASIEDFWEGLLNAVEALAAPFQASCHLFIHFGLLGYKWAGLPGLALALLGAAVGAVGGVVLGLGSVVWNLIGAAIKAYEAADRGFRRLAGIKGDA